MDFELKDNRWINGKLLALIPNKGKYKRYRGVLISSDFHKKMPDKEA